MKTESLKLSWAIIVASTVLAAAPSLRAQSLYSNAVMNLDPVAYWPLQETVQPPRYDMETNYGSLGSVADAYYSSTNVWHEQPGAITGDSDTCVKFTNPEGAIVPTTDNRVSLFPGQPFTVEFWFNPQQILYFRGILSQSGPNNAADLNSAGPNAAGWEISENFAPYRGTASGNNPNAWTFHVFNHAAFTSGAEAEVANTNCWLSGGEFDYTNHTWIYMACVFDGTNAWIYEYSTNLIAADSGTNDTILQFPITTAGLPPAGGPPSSFTNASFVPDTWDPIEFGNERAYTANQFAGGLDEVAIYTNALTFEQISNHFNAGTNGLGNYFATIMADNPYMYWRMDAPVWTSPPATTYPSAMNYGSDASDMTNFVTSESGADSAVYQPGTVPGMPGPSYGGFGPDSRACAFNGYAGAVDAGYNSLLNPTGANNNFSLVAWFKGNPMDALGRYNCLASHSNSSWKAQFQNGKVFAYKGVGAQANIAPNVVNVNDGKWHMYVLESTSGNTGTNVELYLDSGAYSAEVANASSIPGAGTVDAWIGGAPDYAQPTNEASYNTAQQYFAGEICQVAYFTNALTPNQINALYSAARPEPLISRQPVSGLAGVGGAYTNSVGASGQQLAYQWYENNAPLADQTNADLVLDPVEPDSASTNFFVVVTNDYGSVTSVVVALTVVTNLTFVTQYPMTYTTPMTLYGGQVINGTNYLGSTPTFSVAAVGAVPISYQWETNGVAMGGATNASLTITNCQITGPTTFACVLGNSYGSATSEVWSINYLPAPTAPFPQAVLAAHPMGYWRLNEPDDQNYDGNPGAVCNDYKSGNNGLYTNMYLDNVTFGTGYSPATDPSEGAAEFGVYPTASAVNCDAYDINNVDLSVPLGGNGEFTVAVWANGDSLAQPGNAGLVTKGFFNGEEFTLDEGSSISPDSLRFYVRDALANGYDASSPVNLGNNSSWHFVVGVCDEAAGKTALYVDGVQVGGATIPSGAGIVNSAAVPLMIGARSGSASNPGGNQFRGLLNDVAIYNYAMSASQVASQYSAVSGPIAPYLIAPVPSTNASAAAGASLTIPAAAFGTPPMGYVWTNVTTGGTVAVGVTNGYTLNAALLYNNVPAAWNTNQLELIVTNAFGSTNVFVTLSITNAVSRTPANIAFSVTGGNQLTLSWPSDHTGWTLQAQTNNLSVGLSTNWADVANSSTTNKVIIPVSLSNGTVFYRLLYRQ
ncbi:MAG: LamG-like jellyroll fold domain-containing protein [Limisphaerales bacterium]